jgi:hypothetical protein
MIPRVAFIRRLGKHVGLAVAIICGSLGLGVVGYHVLEGFSWIDSLLNASMLLGGMGPVNQLQTSIGKVFASIYALYSGMAFLAIAAVIMAPVLHRFLHHFHIEDGEKRRRSQS